MVVMSKEYLNTEYWHGREKEGRKEREKHIFLHAMVLDQGLGI